MANSGNNLTKKDLVEEIASRAGLTQVDTKIIVENFLAAISQALIEGKNIEIRGFGRFKLRMRGARKARNPRTGEPVNIDAQIRPVFEASKELSKLFDSKSADAKFIEKIESDDSFDDDSNWSEDEYGR